MRRLFATCIAVVILLASCTEQQADESAVSNDIVLETAADTLAMSMVSAMGGLDVWEKIRYVRFDFSVESEQGRRPPLRHLWDKHDGRYRLEYMVGADSSVTVLFNTGDTLGTAYVNGNEVDAEQTRVFVDRAHRRYINDSYWLTAAFKVFDPGVQRGIELDDGVPTLTLGFESVGYTPGDQYWLSASSETGRVQKWTYLLQGRTNKSSYDWVDYSSFDTPHGTLHLSTRKASQTVSIYTDNISFPEAVDDQMFESAGTLLR